MKNVSKAMVRFDLKDARVSADLQFFWSWFHIKGAEELKAAFSLLVLPLHTDIKAFTRGSKLQEGS